MQMLDIIATKRDDGELSPEQVAHFVRGITDSSIPDYQAAALLMAITIRGMTEAETDALVDAMTTSGTVLDWSGVLPPGSATLDKHSTGGVGDKTSLIVVPILAACGVYIGKMSGRGLGHTGGTLDKLESIPGFHVTLTNDELQAQVRDVGAALIGQSGDLAPADKILYALRDVTGTVGSLPLIVASILSKKLAGGADAFLFDVKVGNGALMPTLGEARQLAVALVRGAKRHGKRATAVLSDMNQPLGECIGNAFELWLEARVLKLSAMFIHPGPRKTSGTARLAELCAILAAEGLLLAGKIPDRLAIADAISYSLSKSTALTRFQEIVQAQGGDWNFVRQPDYIGAPAGAYVYAAGRGYIAAIDTKVLGEIVVDLGGGRKRKEDAINPTVGIICYKGIGDAIGDPTEPLAYVVAQTEADAKAAAERVQAAFTISPDPVEPPPLVYEIIRGDELR